MSGRVTRAGRKIRHVAPGHVVDVATGIVIVGARWAEGHRCCSWHVREVRDGIAFPTFTAAIQGVAIAAGICALVRWLGELGQAVRS